MNTESRHEFDRMPFIVLSLSLLNVITVPMVLGSAFPSYFQWYWSEASLILWFPSLVIGILCVRVSISLMRRATKQGVAILAAFLLSVLAMAGHCLIAFARFAWPT